MSDKMRVHILAKELNVSSKAIIDKCKAEGIDTVKNHMSTLSAGLHATIIEWFSEGGHENTLETTDRIDLDKVRVKPKRVTKSGKRIGDESDSATGVAIADDDAVESDESEVTEVEEPEVPARVAAEAPHQVSAPVAKVPTNVVEVPTAPAERELTRAVAVAPAIPQPEIVAPVVQQVAPAVVAAPVEAEATETQARSKPRTAPAPAGPQNVPVPAKLQGPRVVRYEAPDYDTQIPRRGPGPGRPPMRPPGGGPDLPPLPPRDGAKTDKEKEAAARKSRLNTRRATGRLVESGERMAEWRDQDLAERRERLAGATGRRIHRRRSTGPGQQNQTTVSGPKTTATLNEPVRLKDFCSATGQNFIQLFKILKDDFGVLANINMILPNDTAQLLALQFGIELTVVPARTKLDELEDEFKTHERTHPVPRPPVVTILGHVDHGKTSLLDAIRKTDVAMSEDGGITQHIGSYHIHTERGAVTFLDTPGHQAFTAMRARGAKLTDVVVLVVAADDGVMPQTVEAINHAKAANVPIVVAYNKIDLGDQNKLKIYGKLSEMELAPTEWGGNVDVIPTSATTGTGIKELVNHLADLSSVLDLKADPTLPASGTVIEAETKSGVGPVARVLMQDGTLRVGDFVVIGNAAGKVRAIVSDSGARIDEAGPAIPVEVWGLDDVPSSGDRLYQVDSLQRAKEIATEVKQTRLEGNRIQIRKAKSLEEMLLRKDSDEVPELNAIIRADVDGSIAALKQSLSEIPSDKVKLTIRHSGVGAVTDSDILLAATSGGVVVAFRVEASVGAKRLAEQHGVEIRSYRIIYDVVDDVKKALEGLLAPEEKLEARATVEVRQIFHFGKLGLVAGCFVPSGTVERSHLAKVVRDGVVIREGCKFASLRRFKDDVKEVRAGMECGIRLDGFDDVHAGDIIQTYEVIKIAQKL